MRLKKLGGVNRCAAELLLTTGLLLQGCGHRKAIVTAVPVAPEVIKSSLRFQKVYLFVPGDAMEVAVMRAPEASRTVIIRPDGYISLPVVNDVKAAGKSPAELREELTTLLAKRYVNPEVSIIPTVFRQPMVYVTGEIGQAAVAVPFRDAPTALQAITLAGGFRRSSATKAVALMRLSDDGFLRISVINLPDKSQPGAYAGLRALPLQPDDVLFVPENARSQVNRFVNDFINAPLQSVELALGTYTNFRLIGYFDRSQ